MKEIIVEIKLAATEETHVELSAYKIKEMLTTGNFYRDSCLIRVTEVAEVKEETYLCECGVLNLTKYQGCAYCKRPMITRPKKKLEKIIDDEFGLCLMEHKINEIIEYLNKGSKK